MLAHMSLLSRSGASPVTHSKAAWGLHSRPTSSWPLHRAGLPGRRLAIHLLAPPTIEQELRHLLHSAAACCGATQTWLVIICVLLL